MYNLIVSHRAKVDLEDIIAYIATELSAPKAAADFANEVAKCYEKIQENPRIYELA